MKKVVRGLGVLLAMGLCFLAGWRVMPRVWPDIKEAVVYPLVPALRPSPAPVVTPQPYEPEANAALGDVIAASDSVVYYFYKDYCPYCAALEPLMAGLPEQITLPDGTVSNVRLICLNKNEQPFADVIADYYDAYAVPEDRQYVPAVVVGNRYLMPGAEIIDQLLNALAAGEGMHTPMLDGSERVE